MTHPNIHKKETPVIQINFVIRDIDTKETLVKDFGNEKVKMEFNNFYAAHSNLCALNFGLNEFYEIWDLRINKVAYKKRGKVMHK
jgi:hypothetical protein